MSVPELSDHLLRVPGPHRYACLTAQVSPATVRRAVAAGELTRLLPDLYAHPLHAQSWSVRMAAALAWAPPGSAVDGSSALWLRGVGPCPDRAHIAVRPGRHRSTPAWLTLRTLPDPWPTSGTRAALVGCGDVAVTHPVIDAPLAVVRAWTVAPTTRRAEIVYAAVRAGAVAPEQIMAALHGRRVPDRRGLVRVVASAGRGAESYLEELTARDVLYGPQFREVVFQHRVVAGGARYRLDAFHPPTLVAFESDGDGIHLRPDSVVADRLRDAALAAEGITVVRFGYRDVRERPGWCRAIALAAIASRRPGARAA